MNDNAYHFTGECMVPDRSWNAGMELEHWNRYTTFRPLTIGRRVLDIACGEGYGSHLIAETADTVRGLDISPENIANAASKYCKDRANLIFEIGNACSRWSVGDGEIDILLSFETIEHLPNHEIFLSEAARVISDQGVAIISTPLPNCNPATGRPNNPYHLRELSWNEFSEALREYFPQVHFAGQHSAAPFEIHREFLAGHDRYLIGIAAKSRAALLSALILLPPAAVTLRKSRLLRRHHRSLTIKPRPPRLIFVPLVDAGCANPSDRRRIELVAQGLKELGWEAAIMSKQEAVTIQCDIIYTQDRDWAFWLDNMRPIKESGKRFVFTISDLVATDNRSLAHDWDAYNGGDLHTDRCTERRTLARFLNECDLVIAGSAMQARHLQSVASVNIPIVVEYDPLDVETYPPEAAPISRNQAEFRIAWEGFIDNLPYLTVVEEAVKRVASEFSVKVVIAGSPYRRTPFMGTNDNRRLAELIFNSDLVEFHEWNPESISSVLRSADVGIVPLLPGDEFSAVKPPNKAIIYHHLGLPVVASPSESLTEWLRFSDGGIIASSAEQWYRALRTIAINRDYARKLAECGRTAAARFLPEQAVGRIAAHLRELLAKRNDHLSTATWSFERAERHYA